MTRAATNPESPGTADGTPEGRIALAELDRSCRLRPANPAHIRELGRVIDDVPPILVAMPGNRLVDGHMRVDAALAGGHTELAATYVLISGGTDLLLAAAAANAHHGLPLSSHARSRIAREVLRADPSRGNREIARACGVDEGTIRNHRRRMAAEVPRDGAEVARDGAEVARDGAEVARDGAEVPQPHRGHSASTAGSTAAHRPERRWMRRAIARLTRMARFYARAMFASKPGGRPNCRRWWPPTPVWPAAPPPAARGSTSGVTSTGQRTEPSASAPWT